MKSTKGSTENMINFSKNILVPESLKFPFPLLVSVDLKVLERKQSIEKSC